MEFVQVRELIRLRYELRTLLAQNRRERRVRFRQAAGVGRRGRRGAPRLEPEIARWECGVGT